MEAKQKYSIEELADRIRKRPFSIISNNCMIKSVEFTRRCNKMGAAAKVVACLALSHKRVLLTHFRVPIVGLHFYAEVLGKRYEVSREPNDEKCFRIAGDSKTKVLAKLGRLKFSI